MRKNILSLSIAAMIGGLGFVGSASAMTAISNTGTTATALAISTSNRGHILTVPYFTTQNNYMTLLNIVNTDTVNGKAVKVRFRSALNSDDIFDFQLYLSAGDVWAGQVTATAGGVSAMLTRDNSCTLPASINQNFVLDRLPPVTATFTQAQRNNLTREGYVEIFNMADIPPSTVAGSLSRSITHVAGVAPCAGLQAAALDMGSDKSYATAVATGMTNPTGGLFADTSLVNVNTALAFSSEAVAIQAVSAAGTPAAGNLVWFPQTSSAASSPLNTFTADPLLNTSGFSAAMFDLPDLSTPYTGLTGTAAAFPSIQAFNLSSALATKAIANEYITDPSIVATTDWVFSMTTRRYNVAANYSAAAAARRVFTDYSLVTLNGVALTNFFDATNTSIDPTDGNKICVAINPNANYYDRSETTTGTSFVISPGTAVSVSLCGETSVLSFNAGSSNSTLAATVARQDVTLAYTDGWASFGTPGLNGKGLPITGKAYTKAFNGSVAAGVSGNFGGSWEHKYAR